MKAEVDRLLAERAGNVDLTAEWVLTRLREEADCTGEGSSHSARVRALELLGKRLIEHAAPFAGDQRHHITESASVLEESESRPGEGDPGVLIAGPVGLVLERVRTRGPTLSRLAKRGLEHRELPSRELGFGIPHA